MKDKLKIIAFCILGPLTGFVLWVSAFWSHSIRKKFMYKECSINEATHFYITNWDKSPSIVEKISIPIYNKLGNLLILYVFYSFF